MIEDRAVTLSADGRSLAGQLLAPGGAPGTLVVLCHGLGSSRAEFADLPQALVARQAAVLAFDYSGHGQSSGRPGLITAAAHLAETKSAVLWLRATYRGPSLVVAGHSFGAHAALRAGATLRGIVHGVVLISAPPRSGDALPPLRRTGMRLAGQALRWLGPLAPAVRLRYRAAGAGPSGIDLRTLAYAVTVDNVAAARRIARTQVGLVVRGGLDPQVDEAAAAALFDALGSARKRRLDLPGAGHTPFTGGEADALADAIVSLAA